MDRELHDAGCDVRHQANHSVASDLQIRPIAFQIADRYKAVIELRRGRQMCQRYRRQTESRPQRQILSPESNISIRREQVVARHKHRPIAR